MRAQAIARVPLAFSEDQRERLRFKITSTGRRRAVLDEQTAGEIETVYIRRYVRLLWLIPPSAVRSGRDWERRDEKGRPYYAAGVGVPHEPEPEWSDRREAFGKLRNLMLDLDRELETANGLDWRLAELFGGQPPCPCEACAHERTEAYGEWRRRLKGMAATLPALEATIPLGKTGQKPEHLIWDLLCRAGCVLRRNGYELKRSRGGKWGTVVRVFLECVKGTDANGYPRGTLMRYISEGAVLCERSRHATHTGN